MLVFTLIYALFSLSQAMLLLMTFLRFVSRISNFPGSCTTYFCSFVITKDLVWYSWMSNNERNGAWNIHVCCDIFTFSRILIQMTSFKSERMSMNESKRKIIIIVGRYHHKSDDIQRDNFIFQLKSTLIHQTNTIKFPHPFFHHISLPIQPSTTIMVNKRHRMREGRKRKKKLDKHFSEINFNNF